MRRAYLLTALTVGLGLTWSATAAGFLSDPFASGDDIKPFSPCTGAAETGPLTLAQAVDAALCANPQTREVWANARVQAAQLGVAEAAWLPSVSASAGSGRTRINGVENNSRSMGITASWLLFDFGARSANIENARQLFDAANASRDATIQSVLLSTVQAFHQVQGAEASLIAAREAEKAAEQSFRAAEARYQVGSAAPADKLQAQTAWSQSQLTRITAEGGFKTAQGALATVLGRDAHRPVAVVTSQQTLPPVGFERDVNALVEEARQRRPDLVAAQAQLKAAEAGIDAARAAHLPSLSLGFNGSDTRTGGIENRSGTLGLTLNVPLFTGFATTYKVQAAEAQREVKSAQAEKLRLQVAQDVWNAWQSLMTATQSVRASADLVASAEQSDKVARGRYAAGVGTLLEMLTAQSTLASARQQQVQALYNWNIARATLAQSMGVLDSNIVNTATATEGGKP